MGKLVISLLVLTLYLNIGSNDNDDNVMNIAAVLFSESEFSCVSYVS